MGSTIKIGGKKSAPKEPSSPESVDKAAEEVFGVNSASIDLTAKEANQFANSAALPPAPASELKVEQISWFDDRYYRVTLESGEDVYYPSVTTILNIVPNFNLLRWRVDVGREEADRRMNEAADRGSRIHAATSLMEAGGAVVYNDVHKPVYSHRELLELE